MKLYSFKGSTDKNQKKFFCLSFSVCISILYLPTTYANESTLTYKEKVARLLAPPSDDRYKTVQLQQLSDFEFDQSKVQELPVVGATSQPSDYSDSTVALPGKISLVDAIKIAIQRSPDIGQTIASLAAQNANIDVAKAGYYPQLSGGITTGDFTSGERGRQLIGLTATQMLYDFGKVKSSVSVQEAQLQVEQANVLVAIDNIAYDVASSIINIERYKQNVQIAEQQIEGIQYILSIANLRARAGISSQSDPIQAQSYLESAQSSLIAQQSLLRQYQQHLRTLLGFEVESKAWEIPQNLAILSDLYEEPKFNIIPQMLVAQASVEVAKSQKKQTTLSRYPTVSVKGSLNQAVNGVNPNNNKDNGLYSSVMLEASSNFYQGGSIAAQARSASYAEEAAKAKVNAAYLDILAQTRTTRELIDNKQLQMRVLNARQMTTVKTRELYQEQYKLGTRSILDLLTAEMAIHSANSEFENARYDIYNSLIQYISITGRSRQVYNLNNMSIQGFEVQP
ncbi:TolC family protein [Acinetobacter populi]|uniref:RND transporter n=1 Tax=Acinetobacter populi TaxID=1582270 RepID=A0A1Z9Z0W7_9GAMM|nr:TolC family protein [Acinetobacter populi]OUY08052.1 RND transporter [Acinetobacter populi]